MKIVVSFLLGLALLLTGFPAHAVSLCTVQITTAVTGSAQTSVSGFGKPQSLTVQASFTYVASAATSADVYIQTSADSGVTWYDVADFQFTTASANKYGNYTGMTAVTTPVALTDGAISTNTGINGFLGDRFRCKVTTVGTYGSGTTLTVNVFTR